MTGAEALAGLQVFAAVAGAVGALSKGAAEQRADEAQADIFEQQAESERQIATQEAADFRRRQSRLLATRRALGASSGVDISTGTPLMTAGDVAAEGELQALRIEHGGDVRAARLGQQADLRRLRGSQARRSSFFNAGTSLLSGASGGFRLFRGGGAGGAATPVSATAGALE